MNDSTRREILRLASTAAVAAAMEETAPAQTIAGAPFERRNVVRLGVIGLGGRGSSLVTEFTSVPGVEIAALCDVVKDKVDKVQARIERGGKQAKSPAVYHSSERAFEALIKRDDIDLVVAATPWNWHVPMAIAAMKAGKHVAVEVPAARTIDECWQLVNTSEST